MSKKNLNFFIKQMMKMLPDIRAEFFVKAPKNELTRGTISLPQMRILEYLAGKDTCIMSDIARILSVSMSAASSLTDRMVRNKLLKRERSKEDRRIVIVAIRPRGRKIAKSLIRHQFTIIKNIFGKLSEKDRKDYLRILRKIYQNLVNKKV